MLTWFAQEQVASCVAACIRIVVSGFDQFPIEKQVRQILGNPLSGLSLAQAHQRITNYDKSIASLHADWGLIDLRDCLRNGCFPIVGVERSFFGHPAALHAVVLTEVGSKIVKALDPLGSSQPETIKTGTFEIAWDSAGQQALVIKSPFPQIGELKL